TQSNHACRIPIRSLPPRAARAPLQVRVEELHAEPPWAEPGHRAAQVIRALALRARCTPWRRPWLAALPDSEPAPPHCPYQPEAVLSPMERRSSRGHRADALPACDPQLSGTQRPVVRLGEKARKAGATRKRNRPDRPEPAADALSRLSFRRHRGGLD